MGICRFLRVLFSLFDESFRWRYFSCKVWDRFRFLYVRVVIECVLQLLEVICIINRFREFYKNNKIRMFIFFKKIVECFYYGYQIIYVLYIKKGKIDF